MGQTVLVEVVDVNEQERKMKVKCVSKEQQENEKCDDEQVGYISTNYHFIFFHCCRGYL